MEMKKYYLSIASIFKNETWGMKEWLDHYFFHGIDHIYLVNDFSEDDYLNILQPYINDGVVTLFQNDISKMYVGRQVDINNKFFKPILKESQWVANVDLDEYLYSPKEIDLKNIFSKYENYACVVANWVWFNSNGHLKQPPSIVKYFTKRCEYYDGVYLNPPTRSTEWVKFDAPKVIVNSSFDIFSFEIHHANVSGEIINLSYPNNYNDPELLINHYQIQSKEYWSEIKMKRTDMNHINPIRDMNEHNTLDIGDIDDLRLWEQNKNINKVIGMNNLGKNGRLGNQMFQYSALVGISKNKGYDFRIPFDCELTKCFEMKNCDNKYELIDGDEVELHESHEFCEDLFNGCPNNVTLNGYFQTEKYFKNVENLIRLDFKFKEEIEDEVNLHFKKHLDKNPVSIILRDFNDKFDYPGCNNNHRNLPLEYFNKAIELMGKNRTYIICSNNIDMCKQYFKGDNFIFNDIKTRSNKAYFDLCLSSKCKDFIISNSSFAWWAAWIGGGRTIAPTPWYGEGLSHINTDDLYPTNWEKIKC